MPLTSAPPLELRTGDQEQLEAILRGSGSDAQDVLRAGIVLLCAQGTPHQQIRRQLGTSTDTILRWRGRYEAMGLEGLQDAPRVGNGRTSAA